MAKIFLILGAVLGGLGVALGAFGAHALKLILSPDQLQTFETGVRYQFYHSFALLATGIIYGHFTNKQVKLAGVFFLIGIILFSGSLYLLTFLKLNGDVGLKGLGILTPIGGVFFILGWLLLLIGIMRKNA